MNVGVAEVLYPEGHKELDINTINIIANTANTFYFSDKGFLDNGRLSEKVKVIDLPKQYNLKHIYKLVKFTRILNLKSIAAAAKKNNIDLDAIVFLSFDNNLTSFAVEIFAGIDVYVIHHDDIDKISDFMNNSSQNLYNSVKHIVYEDYIKKGLITKTGCSTENVFVVPHPVVFDNNVEKDNVSEKCVLSIGWSSDEKVIGKLIEYSKDFKRKLPYKIKIRSKLQSYKDENLEVISGFLSKEAYDELIRSADIQVILYPDTFKYRYSATFQTALLQNSFVLVNDVFIGRELKKIYPNSVYVLGSIEELFSLDDSILSKCADKNDIELALKIHSSKNIESVLKKMFYGSGCADASNKIE